MIVLKKINNNVAKCIDGNGRELIAFGKGIGFPKTPYELDDLSKITLTFYRLDEHFLDLLNELPEDVLNLSTEVVLLAQDMFRGQLNTNLIFSLADHLSFAIKRAKNNKEINFFLSSDLKELYKAETELAEHTIELVKKRLFITLPRSEVSSLTMHFINAQEEYKVDQEEDLIEWLIEKITELIETEFQITIHREEFNYNRFQMHLRYYLKRVREKDSFIGENQELFEMVKNEHPETFLASQKIHQLIGRYMEITSNKEETLYLMIHINRILEKNYIEKDRSK